MKARDAIFAFVERYRRQSLRRAGWTFACALVSLVLWTALAATLVRWITPWSAGVMGALWALFGLSALGALFWWVLRPRIRLARASLELGREVSRHLGDTRLALISALELGRAETPAGVSAELIAAHLERVARWLAEADPQALVDRRPLRRALLGLGASLLAALVAGAVAPEALWASTLALLEPPTTQVEDGLVRASWVGDIRLAYRYPAYTKREDRAVEGTDGSIAALPGTEVRLTAKADRPLSRALLLLDEGALPLAIEEERLLSGQLVVMRAGAYRFELVDRAGETYRTPRGLSIHLEPDRSPDVRLERPDRDQVVRERDSLELLYDARDDFGLSEVRLVWRILGRSEGQERTVLKRPGDQRAVRQAHTWELSTLKLQAGDQLQFFIEAEDNDSVLGPKAGRSATVTLKVFSAQEQHQNLLAQAQALWEQLLASLGDHLDMQPLGERKPPEAALDETEAPHAELLQGVQAIIAKAEELLDRFEGDELI